VHGEALLERTLEAAAQARAAIDAVPGCAVVGAEQVGRPGVAGWDPMRITVDVRDTGASGYEVADTLRSLYDDHVELATHATVVLVLGIAQPVEALADFGHDFAEVTRRLSRPGTAAAVTRPAAAYQTETATSPRQAFMGPSETITVDEAPGRVSSEAIAGYPPGIPALLPGERITAELVAYLRELSAAGAQLHGASDPAFRTVKVVTGDG
jgi:lysine decarboxylase